MCEKHTRSYILWIYHYLILLTLCEFGVEYKFCVNPAEQSIRAKYISWSENGLTLPTLSCGSFSRIYKKKKSKMQSDIWYDVLPLLKQIIKSN